MPKYDLPDPSTPRIIVLVGLPASGKSTYVDGQGVTPLSSDEVRRILADDITDQNINRLVFFTLRQLLRKRLELRRPLNFIDATNLTPWERKPYIHLAELYGCHVEAVFFDTPLEICQERNRQRGRIVPDEIIARMAKRMIPPSRAEGFSRVTVISGGGAPGGTAAPESAQGDNPGDGRNDDDGAGE